MSTLYEEEKEQEDYVPMYRSRRMRGSIFSLCSSCHAPQSIIMYYRHRLGLEKNLGKLLRERKPPIEKIDTTTSHTAGDCAMRDFTKKYNIERTRRQGKTNLVSRIEVRYFLKN